MSSYNLNYFFDENLQEVPIHPEEMNAYVAHQLAQIKTISVPSQQAQLLAEIGAYLRILRNLDEAEKHLILAGTIIDSHSLPAHMKISQQIRLAHVYQWKKDFNTSNRMFDEILKVCEKQIHLKSKSPLQ